MSVFIDVDDLSQSTPSSSFSQSNANLNTLEIGKGSKVFRGDSSGIWLGAAKYADAPFKVDMDGNITGNMASLVTSLDIGGADTTSFHVDVDGNMWLGNALLASAPFKVTKEGALTASSVTIKDSNTNTIVDATGLVSSTQFSPASASGSTSQTTSSTSYQDVTGLSITIALTRNQNVLLFASIGLKTDDPSSLDSAYGQALVDADVLCIPYKTQGVLVWGGSGYDFSYDYIFVQEILTLSSGSHTFKVQFKSSGGDDVTIDRAGSVVGYVILGK